MKQIPMLLVLIFYSIGFTQDLDMYFQEANELIIECEQLNAQILTPTMYKEIKEKYEYILKLYKQSKSSKEIEKDIKFVIQLAKKAKQYSEIVIPILKDEITAYQEAITAKAPNFAKKEWKNAQSQWENITSEIEKGNIEYLSKNKDKVLQSLRIARKEAIKNSIFTEARQLINSAKKLGAQTFAPITLSIAIQSLEAAENELNQNNDVTIRILYLAKLAKLEAKHAIFLTETAIRLRKEENGWEKGFLSYEEQLNSIAKRFNQEIDWSEGPNKAGQQLLYYLDSLTSSYETKLMLFEQKYSFLENRFIETRKSLENEITELKEKYALLEAKFGVSEKEAQHLKTQQLLISKANKINAAFTNKEVTAEVLPNNQLLIRLSGTLFSSGSAQLNSQLQKILNRLIEILQDLTTATYLVEGHTDSSGDNKKNLVLSEERSSVIANFFKQNLGLTSDRIKFAGKGETEPISDNDTYQGRLKNRRIDIWVKL
ncbi:MAG: OmpA family protein [bacterium]|nr:OmpA family protein [bacterium]